MNILKHKSHFSIFEWQLPVFERFTFHNISCVNTFSKLVIEQLAKTIETYS